MAAGLGYADGHGAAKDDRTSFIQDARQSNVAYSYPLSKRTGLYAAYGKTNNRNGAGYTVVDSTGSGSGDTAATVSIVFSSDSVRCKARPLQSWSKTNLLNII